MLVSDLGLPEQDGFDLIRHVRGHGHDARELSAVALTAFVHTQIVGRRTLWGLFLFFSGAGAGGVAASGGGSRRGETRGPAPPGAPPTRAGWALWGGVFAVLGGLSAWFPPVENAPLRSSDRARRCCSAGRAGSAPYSSGVSRSSPLCRRPRPHRARMAA